MSFTSDRPEDVLFDAARHGDVALLQELLATGLDINTTNPKGFTALTLASYDDHLDATNFLLAAGADPNIQDVTGNSALMALMGVSFKGYPKIARQLIQHGANLNLQNGNGGTALMFATLFGRNELVQLLVEAGADKDIKDARGLTALHLAGQQGNEAAWKFLGGEEPA